jgi:hypothetical protein
MDRHGGGFAVGSLHDLDRLEPHRPTGLRTQLMPDKGRPAARQIVVTEFAA